MDQRHRGPRSCARTTCPTPPAGPPACITSYEVTGTGYAPGYGNSGRKALATKTVTASTASDEVRVDAADLTWSSLDAGVVGWVAIPWSPVAATPPARWSLSSNPATLTDGSDFSVTWPTTGLFVL